MSNDEDYETAAKNQVKDQLIADLTKHVHSKLQKLINDAFELFEMADLSGEECLSAVIFNLSGAQVQLVNRLCPSMTPERFGQLMADSRQVPRDVS